MLTAYITAMDAVDKKIIALLQSDSRMSATDLARLLPMSLSATTERMRRLQTSGVISGFTITVDGAAVGRPIEALIDVRLATGTYSGVLDERLHEVSAVIDAVHLTGRFDTQLRVAVRDVPELDQILETLKEELGAEETNTRLVLRTIADFPRPVQVEAP